MRNLRHGLVLFYHIEVRNGHSKHSYQTWSARCAWKRAQAQAAQASVLTMTLRSVDKNIIKKKSELY